MKWIGEKRQGKFGKIPNHQKIEKLTDVVKNETVDFRSLIQPILRSLIQPILLLPRWKLETKFFLPIKNSTFCCCYLVNHVPTGSTIALWTNARHCTPFYDLAYTLVFFACTLYF